MNLAEALRFAKSTRLLFEYDSTNSGVTLTEPGGKKATGKSLDAMIVGNSNAVTAKNDPKKKKTTNSKSAIKSTAPKPLSSTQIKRNQELMRQRFIHMFPHLGFIAQRLQASALDGDVMITDEGLKELESLFKMYRPVLDANNTAPTPFAENIRFKADGTNFFMTRAKE